MWAMIPMLRRFAADDTSEVPSEEVEGRRPGDLAVGGERRQHFRDLRRAEPPEVGEEIPDPRLPQDVERAGRGERLRGQNDRTVLVRRHAEPLGARARDLS